MRLSATLRAHPTIRARVEGPPRETIFRVTEGYGSWRRLMEIAPRFPQPTCKTLPLTTHPRVSHSSHNPDDDDMTDRLESTTKGGLITTPNRSP